MEKLLININIVPAEKYSILIEFKEGKNLNHRHTSRISRI